MKKINTVIVVGLSAKSWHCSRGTSPKEPTDSFYRARESNRLLETVQARQNKTFRPAEVTSWQLRKSRRIFFQICFREWRRLGRKPTPCLISCHRIRFTSAPLRSAIG